MSEQEKFEKIGAIEAAVEGVKAVAPGLSWDKIVKDIGHEIKQQGQMGSHELAAAIFSGNAFVMYPRGSRDDNQQQGQEQGHGVHGPQQEGQQQGQSWTERVKEERQQERGGREM